MSEDVPTQRGRRSRRRRSRKRSGPRKKTIAVKSLTKNVIRAGWAELGGKPSEASIPARPRTWGECRVTNARPCPWVSCKYHLYLDVDPDTGSIILNHPDLEPWELRHTCALDVSSYGGITLEDAGEILNITRERVRQIEVRAMTRKLAHRLSRLRDDDAR